MFKRRASSKRRDLCTSRRAGGGVGLRRRLFPGRMRRDETGRAGCPVGEPVHGSSTRVAGIAMSASRKPKSDCVTSARSNPKRREKSSIFSFFTFFCHTLLLSLFVSFLVSSPQFASTKPRVCPLHATSLPYKGPEYGAGLPPAFSMAIRSSSSIRFAIFRK